MRREKGRCKKRRSASSCAFYHLSRLGGVRFFACPLLKSFYAPDSVEQRSQLPQGLGQALHLDARVADDQKVLVLRAGGGAGLRSAAAGLSGPSGQISDVKSEITVDKGPKLCYSVIAGLHVNAPSLLRKRPGHIVPGPLSLRHRTPLAAILCA